MQKLDVLLVGITAEGQQRQQRFGLPAAQLTAIFRTAQDLPTAAATGIFPARPVLLDLGRFLLDGKSDAREVRRTWPAAPAIVVPKVGPGAVVAPALLVDQVFDIKSCSISELAPFPAWLQAGALAGVCWAALPGDEVIFLLDCAAVVRKAQLVN